MIVLYDEGCGFCTRVAQRLSRRPGIRVEAIGSPAGSLLLRDLTVTERYASLHAVDRLGRRHSGGAALPAVLRKVRYGRPLAVLCELLPGVAEALYRSAARHRGVLSAVTRRDYRYGNQPSR